MNNKDQQKVFLYFFSVVCFAHVLFISASVFLSRLPQKKEQKGKLVVKTIDLAANDLKTVIAPFSQPKPIEKIPAKPPLPPKSAVKPIKKEEPVPKSGKPALKPIEEKPKKDTQKWQQVREALKDLTKKQTASTLSPEPQATPNFQKAEGYDVRLMMHLKETLRLPEKGILKVLLKISKKGELLDMKVSFSESDQNRAFVENALKKMHFPPFDKSLKEKTDEQFLITLEGI